MDLPRPPSCTSPTGLCANCASGASAAAGWGFRGSAHRLDPGPEGQEHGELIAAIGGRYQVGLIDEFQDTDPLQWRILRQAFSCPDRHLLVMVGDPKQAIYGFRGGDLGTYQAVRHSTERVVALRQNFRSSTAFGGEASTG